MKRKNPLKPDERLWPHPTLEQAFDDFHKLDAEASKAIAAAKSAIQTAETAYRSLTGQAAHLARLCIMQRDNAEAALHAKHEGQPAHDGAEATRPDEKTEEAEARTQAPGGDARDAARYRWLRDFSQPAICAFYLSVGKAFDGVRFTRETVDTAIDEQIASAPSSPPLSGWTNGPGRNGGPGGCDPGVTP